MPETRKINSAQKTKPDTLLLVVFLALLIWGTFTMGATSFDLSLKEYNNVWYLFLHQLTMIGIGLVLAFLAYKLPLKHWRKMAPFLFLINLILVFLVFAPKIGVVSKGAHRWISLFGFSFQPSEFLKITFLLYLSSWLSSRKQQKKQKEFEGLLLPFLIILGVLFSVLILQPDMTTLFIICAAGTAVYFSSKVAIWWHYIVLAFLGGTLFLISARLKPYRWDRIISFLNRHIDPLNKGYQLKQSTIAIGSGKIFGVGNGFSLGFSRQKLKLLPEPLTDSIFAVVAEELGFLGAVSLIVLFLLFCWRGVLSAKRCGQNFEGFLALGITVWITLQGLANIGGITGIFPLGGIPLPFFSYGGSHIIAELIGIGLLLNVSRC